MKYIYYPGCSMCAIEGTAVEYDISTQASIRALGSELVELEDWTCCGATAAPATSYLISNALAARNLALGERMNEDADLLIPCSACYLNLAMVGIRVKKDPGLLAKINQVLSVENLSYNGGIKVRHLLDVLVNDLRPETIEAQVEKKLSGLRVAPYYGCQALRPYCDFDDSEHPQSMEPLISALGAEIHKWMMGPKCCGAALMSTKRQVALEHVANILSAAKGADCIVTVCPMCHINLEAYQKNVSKARGEDLTISVLYLPQLMGLAFGLSQEEVKLDLNLVVTDSLKKKLEV